MALSVEVSQRCEFGVEVSEEAAEVNQARRHAGHSVGSARASLALQIGDEGRLEGRVDVDDTISERLGLLPVRRRGVKDAQMEQHPMARHSGRHW